MPFVAIGRIAKALESLPRFHAFFGVTFLSMKKSGVSTGDPIVWGSRQEQELINEYYAPPGAHLGKPFFIPFGRPDKNYGYWKNPKYSGGTLQRARTTDNFRPALNHPTPEKWGFSDTYLQSLELQLPQVEGENPIRLPVIDLVSWLFRERELPDNFEAIISLFRDEFNLTDDHEFERLFDANVSDEDPGQFFFNEQADRNELIVLLGGIPEGPSLGGHSEDELITGLERFVSEEALLSLPEGFVRNFYYSLKTQRFVILAGRPGTGKTSFARAFAAALSQQFPESVNEKIVSVGQDFGESDVIGYEKIAGGLAPTELTELLFLSGRQRDIYVVILDEMNLAHVDYYLARLLPAIESDAPIVLPGIDNPYKLPPDAFFIGTVNSFIEEPTRVALSGPVKRRANIITIPNTLDLLLQSGDRNAFKNVVKGLLKQTKQRCVQKSSGSLSSVFDLYRMQDLDAALGKESPILEEAFLGILWEICSICASDPQTSLTLGVLQDIAEYVALSHWDNILMALDHQISQKLAPQLSGPVEIVKRLEQYIESIRSEDHRFENALTALKHLLETADPSSGLVYYRY